MSEQVKICPHCKKWNEAKSIECIYCGTDLVNVKPISKEQASSALKSTPKSSPTKGKICTECGHVNPPQARKCEQCKEDLSDVKITDIEPTAKDQTVKKTVYEFITVDGTEHFEIPDGQMDLILGREGFLSEYLSTKPYVSRQQAAIAIQDNSFKIKNLSRTNPTFVDNQALENGKEYSFPFGKEIGLGGKVINGNRQSNAAYLVLKEKT